MPKHAHDATWLLKWIALGAFLLVAFAVSHNQWLIHQIRKPVYADICSEGRQQASILEMAYASNLAAAEDAVTLHSVRIASGSGSIPIQELRVPFRGGLVDLGEHPAWKRVILIMRVQDSAANVVLLHNLSYCNMKEPWTIWPKSYEPQRAPVYSRPDGVEVAEAG